MDLFANDFLKKTASRIAPSQNADICLDKNELPFDLPEDIKAEVFQRLTAYSWNRYPEANTAAHEKIIADYIQAPPEQLVLGAGSAQLLTELLNYFAINHLPIFIAAPSFTLFEFHCKTHAIPYSTWNLSPNFEYDYFNFPELNTPSVIVLSSPNNPTGTCLNSEWLVQKLEKHPASYFIVDEVYFEFCQQSVAHLVARFSNLIVVRSLSKAFGVAGLRIGYLLTQSSNAQVMRKLLLPFSLNYFSRAFIEVVLAKPQHTQRQERIIGDIIAQQKKVIEKVRPLQSSMMFELFSGPTNFFMLRFAQSSHCKIVEELLRNDKIACLNLSRFPMLENCIRISVGTADQNQKLIESFAYINEIIVFCTKEAKLA